MIVRYYRVDFTVPCIENEILFHGTEEECLEYIRKNYGADKLSAEYEINLDFLYGIQIGKSKNETLFPDDIIVRNFNNGQDSVLENVEWNSIKIKDFVFNECVVDMILQGISLSP